MATKKKKKMPFMYSDKIEKVFSKLYDELQDDFLSKMIENQADSTYGEEVDMDDLQLGIKLGMKLARRQIKENNPELRICGAADNEGGGTIYFFIADEDEICERLENKLLHLVAGLKREDEEDDDDLDW